MLSDRRDEMAEVWTELFGVGGGEKLLGLGLDGDARGMMSFGSEYPA